MSALHIGHEFETQGVMGDKENPKRIAVIARPHCRELVMARDWLVETGELAEGMDVLLWNTQRRKPRQTR